MGKRRFHLSSNRGVVMHSERNSANLDPDPARDLNNFLQARRDANGNFSRYLSWVMDKDGPDNQKTHYATAKCEQSVRSEC